MFFRCSVCSARQMKLFFIASLFVILVVYAPASKVFAISEEGFNEAYDTLVVPMYENGVFGEFEGCGGVRIRYAAFEQDNETGALVILHGKSESYIKYAELVYDLKDLGLSCYLMDHRGFGFSERLLSDDPQKTHVGRFDEYVADVKTFIDTVVQPHRHSRVFLLAHSLGGCIAARYLETHPGDITAAVLSAPMLQINTGSYPQTIAYAIAFAATARGKGTEYALGQGPRDEPRFEKNITTHSYARWSKWEEDLIPAYPQIRSGGATYNWVKESMEAGWLARKQAAKIATPLLIFQAEEDLFVTANGQHEFCEAAQDCTKVFFHGARHEILMETDSIRNIALGMIRAFFRGYLYSP
ncbi:MAG: alpha/beta fold hydrolase [Desulfobacterota bacterium]|nr:alpha/beta fold hydrolase [Thermodesulfobacteriota bacterium]